MPYIIEYPDELGYYWGKDTIVISGFPGVGKSTYWAEYNTPHVKLAMHVLDSDSSEYSWCQEPDGDRYRNPDFPANYLRHIQDKLGFYDVIMVSSHEEIRQLLVDAKIPFFLVYPDIDQKKEYIERYVARNSEDAFIDLLNANWLEFIHSCEQQAGCTHITLKGDEYLSDVIPEIKKLST